MWIFFKEPLAAVKARKLGNAILTEAMNRDGRVSLKSYPWEVPVPPKITNEDFPKEVVCVKADMLYVSLAGLSGRVLNHIKRIASFKNPEFYAKQGMRLSTYNIPSIISCADVYEKYVALPRGCEDAIVELLKDNHVCYRMKAGMIMR